jgi:hypothetical protein
LEPTIEAANMLIGRGKFEIPAATGVCGTIVTERRLRIKMNKAEIRELIPVARVYPGVGWLLRRTGERP